MKTGQESFFFRFLKSHPIASWFLPTVQPLKLIATHVSLSAGGIKSILEFILELFTIRMRVLAESLVPS